MGSEDRALRVKAHAGPPASEVRGSDTAVARTTAEHRRETEEYARQAMVSSARAHDRAAQLLERMATAHPDEAEVHLQSAARHRRWAENDRSLAKEFTPPDGGPDTT